MRDKFDKRWKMQECMENGVSLMDLNLTERVDRVRQYPLSTIQALDKKLEDEGSPPGPK